MVSFPKTISEHLWTCSVAIIFNRGESNPDWLTYKYLISIKLWISLKSYIKGMTIGYMQPLWKYCPFEIPSWWKRRIQKASEKRGWTFLFLTYLRLVSYQFLESPMNVIHYKKHILWKQCFSLLVLSKFRKHESVHCFSWICTNAMFPLHRSCT